MKKVAAGIIVDGEGKVLLARRAKTEPLSGWYEFPGGKLELYETSEMALIRELKEELDIDCNILSHFRDTEYKYDSGLVKIHFYWLQTKNTKDQFKMRVHDDLVWVNPINFPKYKILKSNHSICLRILNLYFDNNRKLPSYLLNKI
jgi:mutator protein MutT